ncbi:MAG: hypothetical protein ABJB66_20715, partial [Gemmatimonadaceae bacterium]
PRRHPTCRTLSARLAIVPGWDEDEPMQESLPNFPGAQMQIIIPEKMADAAKTTPTLGNINARATRERR